MYADQLVLEVIHWTGTAYLLGSIVASTLVRFVPPPEEIRWRPYAVFYNTLQRLSAGRRRKWEPKR